MDATHWLNRSAGDFDTSYHDIRQAAWDGYTEVRGNRYRVPEAWSGRPVSIRITLNDELRVYGNDVLIATHRLSSELAWQTVPEHHQLLWQRTCYVEQRPLADYEELLRWQN
jgi:hypothetical protein